MKTQQELETAADLISQALGPVLEQIDENDEYQEPWVESVHHLCLAVQALIRAVSA